MNESLLTRLRPVFLAVAALFLVGNAFFLLRYNETRSIQQDTRRALDAAAKELADLQAPTDIGQLREQLALAEKEIQAAEKAYPRDAASFDLLFELSRSAAETGVAITQLRSEPVAKERLVSLEHWTVRYTVEASGPAPGLANFLERIEKFGQSTLVLDNLIVRPIGGQWTAAFHVVVYAREEPKGGAAAPPPPPIRPTTPRPQT